jgi:two-component system phosphate regulon sensor histidine kinase PhoR
VFITVRKSDSIGENYMYASTKTEQGEILRLAHAYPGFIKTTAAQLPAIASAMVIAIVLSLFLANRFSNAVTRPLGNVVNALTANDFESLEQYSSGYFEVDKTLRSISRLLEDLAASRQTLVEEREKVEFILSGMAEGLIMIDSRKSILLCNERAKKLLGIKHSVTGDNIMTVIWDAKISEAIDGALRRGRSSETEWRPQDSCELLLRVSIAPSSGTAGKEGPGATVMLVDVTAKSKLEEQKQDFFATASHELRTPVTSILGFAEMLNSGLAESEETRKNALSRIEKETRRMSQLIDDILMISNLESKAEQTERVAVRLDNVAREAAEAVSPMCGDDKIEVTLETEPVTLLADERQLHELCVNLIENAVKYNKPGGRVSIEVRGTEQYAALIVSDTGLGIPAKYQPRVFERFYRVGNLRGRKIPGTGLGLSIVKHITGLYGGELLLKSEAGAGTRIEVRLPV